MSVFEFTFSLFSLLLGLSLAEVLGGVARAVESRKRASAGALTLLLAVLMVADIVSFWSSAWFLREQVTFSFRLMMSATAFAGAYYVAAYLVFPREAAVGRSPDEHFFAVRRPILGIMLVANLVQVAVFVSYVGWAYFASQPQVMIKNGVICALFVASMLAGRERPATVVLALTATTYIASFML